LDEIREALHPGGREDVRRRLRRVEAGGRRSLTRRDPYELIYDPGIGEAEGERRVESRRCAEEVEASELRHHRAARKRPQTPSSRGRYLKSLPPIERGIAKLFR
jgi:hypothetical protein